MTGNPSDNAAAAFEYHKAQVVSGLNRINEDFQHLQSALQGFTQFISSASFSPNGQTVFAIDGHTPGKPGRKRKFKDEDGRRARKIKDPLAPRRPASSYILFQNEIRPSLKEKFPGLTHTELMNRVSKLWSELPSERKEMYERQHAEAKVAYEEKKQQYEDSKNGPAPLSSGAAAADGSSEAETESPAATKKDDESNDEDAEEDVEEEDEEMDDDGDEPAPPKKKSKSWTSSKQRSSKNA